MWRKVLVSILFLPLSAHGFYQFQTDDMSLELRGLVRGLAVAANNPNDVSLFEHDEVLTGGGFGRLMLDIENRGLSVEMHAVQSYVEPMLRTGGSRVATTPELDRSQALHWRFSQQHADLVFDRLNLQYNTDKLSIKVGRQPINLAATYYFTPNDFFAPFSAQTFYRTYKPGVDAARLDWQWDELSQLSIYSVLDYPLDKDNSGLRQTHPDWNDTSVLARVSTLIDNFEWAVLLGKQQGDDVVGFDFQGELFDWLGVRGEGHLRFPEQSSQNRDAKFSLGVEHRFETSLTLRLGQFYQRSGVTESSRYSFNKATYSNTFYLARNYTALGASYEFTPLLNGDAVWIFNHHDQSSLLSLYSTYSLSDESELAIGMSIPFGKSPKNGNLNSEFGSYAKSVNLEYRLYF